MYVQLYSIAGEHFIAASMSEGRVVWANYSDQRVITEVRLPQDCGGAFSASGGGRRLATGYWEPHGIDVWELPSGERVDHLKGHQTSQLFLEPSGRYLAIRAHPKKCVRDLETGVEVPIRRLEHLHGACFDERREALWLPIDRKSSLARVTFDPLEASEITSRIGGRIWPMRYSPLLDRAIVFVCHRAAVDPARSRGRVVCLTEIEGDVLWERPLTGRDTSTNGAFSGDGYLLGAYASDADSVIVLDANTGDEIRRIEGREAPEHPLEGSTVMTSTGRIVDLESGKTYDAVNKPAWWRAAGLRFG